MHLLFFVQYFPPENASGLPIIQDMIESFAYHGWKVDVYVPTPTRGVTDEIRREYKKKKVEILCDGNLIIHRMPLYREGTRILQRSIRYTFFSIQCLLKALFTHADAIFTGAAPPSQGLVVGLTKWLTKKKVIYNPQDLFPDSLIVSGKATEESIIVKVGRLIEKYAYKNADIIITITEDMAETIRTRVDNKNKVKVVRNWIDTEKTIHIDKEDNKLYDELNINRDKFTVVYAGNLGMMQGVEIIVEAARLLKNNQSIQFLIFGNGSEEDNIRANIIGLPNVSLYPLQPVERASEVYSLGDVSIISCKAGTGAIGMPSKTWTIMAAGIPIIASFDLGGEMEKVIMEACCGFTVKAGDVKGLAWTIESLSNNPRLLRTLGNNARKYACENVSKAKAVQQYIDLLSVTCEEKNKTQS